MDSAEMKKEEPGTGTENAAQEKTASREVPENDKKAEETEETEPKTEKKKIRHLETELAEARKKLESAEAGLKEEKDKYMRMIAEYDNFRKRTQKEKENTYADAYADAVNAILPVLDNLERAEQYDDPEAVKKGVSMTLKAAKDTFTKLGITEIETKTFDPNLHNAVMHIEDDQLGEGEIVEVLQKGYRKGDKIIRYAMVKVAN